MVVHEPRVGTHRELRERRRIGRPDGAAERNEELVDERSGVPAATQERLDRLVVRVVVASGSGQAISALPSRFVRHEPARGPIEPHDVGEQTQERGSRQVPPLREHRVEIRAPVFEPAPGVGDAEAHLRRLGLDAQLAQQAGESRVVRLVVDDEPGIDRVRDATDLDVDGMGVAADAPIGLVDASRRDRGAGRAPRRAPTRRSRRSRSSRRLGFRSSSGTRDTPVPEPFGFALGCTRPGNTVVARGRRSSQNAPFDARASGAAASHAMVSAPCSGDRRSGCMTRRKPGSDSCTPGVSAHPGCIA